MQKHALEDEERIQSEDDRVAVREVRLIPATLSALAAAAGEVWKAYQNSSM